MNGECCQVGHCCSKRLEDEMCFDELLLRVILGVGCLCNMMNYANLKLLALIKGSIFS